MKLCSDYKLSKVFNAGEQPNWNRKTKQGLLCVFCLKRALSEVKALKMYRMIYVIRNLPKAVCVCVFLSECMQGNESAFVFISC